MFYLFSVIAISGSKYCENPSSVEPTVTEGAELCKNGDKVVGIPIKEQVKGRRVP